MEDNGGRSDNCIPFQCRSLPPTTWHDGAHRFPGANVGAGGKMTGCVIEGTVGNECQIWRGAQVMVGATLGDNCMLGGNVLLNSGAIVGNNVRVQQCSAISGTCVIHDNVYIGSCVNFCNAKEPTTSRAADGTTGDIMLPIVVEEGASIGAGVCILGGVTIGAGARIGAGSVVTKDVPAGETWVGNPARNIRQ